MRPEKLYTSKTSYVPSILVQVGGYEQQFLANGGRRGSGESTPPANPTTAKGGFLDWLFGGGDDTSADGSTLEPAETTVVCWMCDPFFV